MELNWKDGTTTFKNKKGLVVTKNTLQLKKERDNNIKKEIKEFFTELENYEL
jgi:DNA-binding transcriptional regulator YhcF (GntR family)